MNAPEHDDSTSLKSGWMDKIFLVAVMLLLGAFAYGGHRFQWKVPKFSRLLQSEPSKEDWCESHHVPESICVECNPGVYPAAKPHGWCAVHGVSECPVCHPELASVTYADLPAFREKCLQGMAFLERKANNPICKTHQRRIQFASVEEVDKAGVSIEPAWVSPMTEYLSAPGEIVYDQTRQAHLSSRASGTVWKVIRHLGDRVKANETLALIDSAEVGKAKSELMQMFALSLLRTQTLSRLRAAGIATPAATLEEAESALRESLIRMNAARQALVNLGLPLENFNLQSTTPEALENKLHFLGIPLELHQLMDPTRTTRNLLPVISPMDGTIVSREVVAGEVVDTTRILFEVVNNEYKWITLDVRNEDARFLHTGQKVLYNTSGAVREVECRIDWISTQADLKTRTIKARANLEDKGGQLRANTFGNARIILREEPKALCVPRDAVQWDGCCQVVFVRDKNFLDPKVPKLFHVRKVRTGARDDSKVEILAGLLPGELVVHQGSGLLLTELLRGNLGEGCACHSKK